MHERGLAIEIVKDVLIYWYDTGDRAEESDEESDQATAENLPNVG
jgi:hypothetical protein